MNNAVLFTNTFLSYLLLMVIIVVIAGIAIFIGIKLRKRKDEQEALEAVKTETDGKAIRQE